MPRRMAGSAPVRSATSSLCGCMENANDQIIAFQLTVFQLVFQLFPLIFQNTIKITAVHASRRPTTTFYRQAYMSP